MPSSTISTGPVSGTMRGPVFVSRNRNTRAVRSTSSHLRVRISSDRQPVRISRRIAAIALDIIEPAASIFFSAAPSRRYSSGVRKRSRDVSRYCRTWRVGLRPGGTIPPVLGQHEHLGQDPYGLVGRRRPVPQRVVQRRHVLGSDILQGLLSQGGKDVVLDGQPVVLGGPALAPHRDMVLETEFREVGDGGLGRRFRRDRILAPLDPVDNDGGLAPAHVDRLGADPPQRHPLEAGWTPGLYDVELAPGGVDPYAEAGQIPVPEDRVLAVGLEPLHNPLGQSERAPLRHLVSPGARILVIKPEPGDIKIGA